MKPLRSDVLLFAERRRMNLCARASAGAAGMPSAASLASLIDLAFWIDDACERLVERDHVDDELRAEAHIRVEEQEVRGVALVEPACNISRKLRLSTMSA